MGWGSGVDNRGKQVGYTVSAKCEYPGCKAKIDRGLNYACGGEHGEFDHYCNGYFCDEHLFCVEGYHHKICVYCKAEIKIQREGDRING